MPTSFAATATAPRVTVAVPAYRATFLKTALDSVLAQDMHDLELLICDDCPTDAVAEVVKNFLDSEHGAQIRYLRNPQPLLEVGNFGRCIAQARGTYLKFLCDDDVLLPGCLTAMADVLDRHPEVALVSSRRQLIDERGALLPESGANAIPFEGDVCVHGQELVSFLAERTLNFIGEPSTVMFRTAQMRPMPMRRSRCRGGVSSGWATSPCTSICCARATWPCCKVHCRASAFPPDRSAMPRV